MEFRKGDLDGRSKPAPVFKAPQATVQAWPQLHDKTSILKIRERLNPTVMRFIMESGTVSKRNKI